MEPLRGGARQSPQSSAHCAKETIYDFNQLGQKGKGFYLHWQKIAEGLYKGITRGLTPVSDGGLERYSNRTRKELEECLLAHSGTAIRTQLCQIRGAPKEQMRRGTIFDEYDKKTYQHQV